jgi:hypothetical protein
MQDLGASPFLQSVTMIVAALSLGWLLTPARQRAELRRKLTIG